MPRKRVRVRGPGPPDPLLPSALCNRFSILVDDDPMDAASQDFAENRSPPKKKSATAPKRHRVDVQPVQDGRPVILHCRDRLLGRQNPKVVQEHLRRVCGTEPFITRCLKGGDLLVCQITPACSSLLLGLTVLGDWPVVASLPASLRGSRGLIRDVPGDLSAEEILTELSTQNVLSVNYLCARFHTDSVAADHRHTLVLAFESSNLPDVVCLFSQAFRVDKFRERALLCYRCQGLGHSSKFCRNRIRCGKCGGPHLHSQCETPQVRPFCVNCRGVHFSDSPACPVRQEANAVCRVAVRYGTSYAAALRSVRARAVTGVSSQSSHTLRSSSPRSVSRPSSQSLRPLRSSPVRVAVPVSQPPSCHQETQVDEDDFDDCVEDSDATDQDMEEQWVRHVGLQTPFFLGYPGGTGVRPCRSSSSFFQVVSNVTEEDIVQMVSFLQLNADAIVRHIRARDCPEDWVQLARFLTAVSL